jgi:hypothetical protein
MSIAIGTKMLTKPPKQKSKTHLKKHTLKKKNLQKNFEKIAFCTSFYTDVDILICHLLPIRLYLIRSWKCVVP